MKQFKTSIRFSILRNSNSNVICNFCDEFAKRNKNFNYKRADNKTDYLNAPREHCTKQIAIRLVVGSTLYTFECHKSIM